MQVIFYLYIISIFIICSCSQIDVNESKKILFATNEVTVSNSFSRSLELLVKTHELLNSLGDSKHKLSLLITKKISLYKRNEKFNRKNITEIINLFKARIYNIEYDKDLKCFAETFEICKSIYDLLLTILFYKETEKACIKTKKEYKKALEYWTNYDDLYTKDKAIKDYTEVVDIYKEYDDGYTVVENIYKEYDDLYTKVKEARKKVEENYKKAKEDAEKISMKIEKLHIEIFTGNKKK